MDATQAHIYFNYIPLTGTVIGIVMLVIGFWKDSRLFTRTSLALLILTAILMLAVYATGEIAGKGSDQMFVDMNVQPLTGSDIEWADIVFLSAMIVQRESLDHVVKLCKKLGKRVAVGGPYVSTSSDLVPEADFVFVGEAETTLPEFIYDLKCGSPKRIYQAAERPSLLPTPVPDFGFSLTISGLAPTFRQASPNGVFP